MTKTKVGIDYSMTSPAICVGEGTFTSCRIQFLTPTKKFAKSYLDGKIKGSHLELGLLKSFGMITYRTGL